MSFALMFIPEVFSVPMIASVTALLLKYATFPPIASAPAEALNASVIAVILLFELTFIFLAEVIFPSEIWATVL